MSGSSQFPPPQFIPPSFDARPHANYNPYIVATTGPTPEESEQPPQKKPRFSGEPFIPNLPGNYFPNPMMHPPNLRPQNFQPTLPPQNNKSALFFKTRLCKAFLEGHCSHGPGCNFAHGQEDLRKPPPNWQSILGVSNEQQITNHKICRFFNGEKCHYGDKCTFLHVNQDSQAREQQMGANWNENFNGNGNQKTAYYKTKLCHKYEKYGFCHLGDKCQYAHGITELKSFGGNKEVDIRLKIEAAAPTNPSPEPAPDAPPTTTHQPSCVQHQTQEEDNKPLKWKGLEHMSRIYGDWIYNL